VVITLCSSLATITSAQTGGRRTLTQRDGDFYSELARDRPQLQGEQFLVRMLSATRMVPKKTKQVRKLDLTPLADIAIAYLKDKGLPLEEERDEKKRPIAVSAEFAVGQDVPSVKFHLGDRPNEAIAAFYPPEKGIRFSVVYPLEHWSLRFEGGEDSEFGSLAVAGVTWVHPSKRYAAGFGLPMRMKHASGDFGAIFQFRVNLR
jgi:hypothetical protein